MIVTTLSSSSVCFAISFSLLLAAKSAQSFVPLESSRCCSSKPAFLLQAALGDLSSPEPPPLDQALVDAAHAQLPWEKLLEKQKQPVLDLSQGNNLEEILSLSQEAKEGAKKEGEVSVDDTKDVNNNDTEMIWQNGELWAKTRVRLVDLWVLPRDMSNGADVRYAMAASQSELKMLKAVPQLLRLDTVVEAAETILDLGLPPALLRSEPVLLSYPPSLIEGGIDFLATMSMLTSQKDMVIKACKDTPGLLVGSIEGHIQEQTVKKVLGDAAEATAKTNRQVAADLSKAFRAVKGGDKPPGSNS